MIQKRILVAERLRRPPATGWSWVDRRFLREHGDHLSREAMLLYLFLAAVADRHGLSFYSDHTLTSRLRLSLPALEKARQELLDRDLIAHQLPLVQVLSLPAPGVSRRPEPGQGLMHARRNVPPGRSCARQPKQQCSRCRAKEGHAMNVALWAEIRRLAEIDKLSGRAIARRLHCSRHTVAAALKLQQPPAQTAAPRASLLDPYLEQIKDLLAKYPDLSAVRIREEIARGPQATPAVPSSCAATCARSGRHAAASTRRCITNRPRRCRSIGANAAACKSARPCARSRCSWPCSATAGSLYIEFTLSQRKAEFYRGLVNALTFFGGSPRNLIFDNLKAAVLNGSGRSACFHPEFLALCGYFCMQPIACARRDPESKGVVEGGVRYVKHNALAGRADELLRFEDYLALATYWRDQVANVRLHETTRERPHRSLPEGACPVAAAARHPLRHRRSRAGRGQSACPHRLRRQSLFRAAAVRAQDPHRSRQS